jgi:hypothetical protein
VKCAGLVKEEMAMTHIETARVNEMLGLQIGVVQDAARKLQGDNLEQLESDMRELENAIKELWGMMKGLPLEHRA